MSKVNQLRLFRRNHRLQGDHQTTLASLVGSRFERLQRVDLYHRMQQAQRWVNDLRAAREYETAHRLHGVFRRLCWPGALSSLPLCVYEAHTEELTAWARNGCSLRRSTRAEVLWALALESEHSGLSDEAVEIMQGYARHIFGPLDSPQENLVSAPVQQRNQIRTELHMDL